MSWANDEVVWFRSLGAAFSEGLHSGDMVFTFGQLAQYRFIGCSFAHDCNSWLEVAGLTDRLSQNTPELLVRLIDARVERPKDELVEAELRAIRVRLKKPPASELCGGQ